MFFYKDYQLVAFRQPHPVGNFHDLLLHERPPSLGGKSLKYRAWLTIINRSNYTYHFLLSDISIIKEIKGYVKNQPYVLFVRWLVFLFLV